MCSVCDCAAANSRRWRGNVWCLLRNIQALNTFLWNDTQGSTYEFIPHQLQKLHHIHHWTHPEPPFTKNYISNTFCPRCAQPGADERPALRSAASKIYSGNHHNTLCVEYLSEMESYFQGLFIQRKRLLLLIQLPPKSFHILKSLLSLIKTFHKIFAGIYFVSCYIWLVTFLMTQQLLRGYSH